MKLVLCGSFYLAPVNSIDHSDQKTSVRQCMIFKWTILSDAAQWDRYDKDSYQSALYDKGCTPENRADPTPISSENLFYEARCITTIIDYTLGVSITPFTSTITFNKLIDNRQSCIYPVQRCTLIPFLLILWRRLQNDAGVVRRTNWNKIKRQDQNFFEIKWHPISSRAAQLGSWKINL